MNESIKIEAPVDHVTLLEDRAHVRRVARVDLSSTRVRLRIEGLAPILADKTLCARFEDGGRVLDTSVERALVVLDEDKSEKSRALESKKRDLERDRAIVSAKLARIVEKQSSVRKLAELQIEDILVDAAWNRVDRDGWSEALSSAAADEDTLAHTIVTETIAVRELDRKIADVQAQLAAAATPSRVRRAAATLEVEAIRSGPATLVVEYVVPAACWRPHHRAELSDSTVKLSTDASVWQNTGEDWTDAQLSFSTERPSLGSSPPPLASDVVHAVKKGPTVTVDTREQEVETAGLGGGGPKVLVPDVPGIDDGGDPMLMRAPARATIPSDGHPHRVPLASFTADAKISLVLMAELAPAVITKAELPNAGTRPILPGPVDLVRDSGLIGRTTLEFVAPGERFEMGWGPDANLRVAREVRDLESEKRMLSSWTKTPRVVEVHVSNLGREAKHIEVTERVLVSEVEKVKIDFDAKKTSDQKTPDADGFVRWTIDVAPAGRRTLKFAYTLEKHADVVGVV